MEPGVSPHKKEAFLLLNLLIEWSRVAHCFQNNEKVLIDVLGVVENIFWPSFALLAYENKLSVVGVEKFPPVNSTARTLVLLPFMLLQNELPAYVHCCQNGLRYQDKSQSSMSTAKRTPSLARLLGRQTKK